MNRLLLKVWQALPDGEVRQAEIAQLLNLSQRQTKRWLERWDEEKWLTYRPGTGRGRKTRITWLKNIEEVFVETLIPKFSDKPLQNIVGYLDWEWSESARKRLEKQFSKRLGYQTVSDHRFIFPIKYPFLTFHPLEAIDLNSVHICENLYKRLFTVNEEGKVRGELVHYWEISNQKIRIFLKNHVKFHDGSTLNSTVVRDCLTLFFNHPHYQGMTSQVISVRAPHSLVVEIELNAPCSYMLHLLSITQASIYKVKNRNLLGTGPFYVDFSEENLTRIRAHEEYYRERPYLDAIDFIKVNSDSELIYRTNTSENLYKAQKITSESGFGVLVFNLFRDSTIQRKEVRDYIHYLIRKEIHTILAIVKNSTDNNRGFLVNDSTPYTVKKPLILPDSQPLILATSRFTQKLTEQVKEVLEGGGLKVELLLMEHEKYVSAKTSELEADLFISREHFSLDQNLSFYLYFKAGYSQISDLMEKNEVVTEILSAYAEIPVENWLPLHLEIEREVISNSWLVPLYFNQRKISYPSELMGISAINYGYADYSKLWIKPEY
ncbi:ABC transporter substrate-binding protein [Planococcus halocryophilus]|uniref:ABC transporter substrate-binding protein n=1 Tax=Planococcus halocryophilus TaxID=1215089 RepID=UPI001F10F963|nr:ABC transporter substrate-binding protein [Planococcus halocryophilus]MCH4825187.1 ABC transporter substrate-binding protein [Planococcus halocryophilus]